MFPLMSSFSSANHRGGGGPAMDRQLDDIAEWLVESLLASSKARLKTKKKTQGCRKRAVFFLCIGFAAVRRLRAIVGNKDCLFDAKEKPERNFLESRESDFQVALLLLCVYASSSHMSEILQKTTCRIPAYIFDQFDFVPDTFLGDSRVAHTGPLEHRVCLIYFREACSNSSCIPNDHCQLKCHAQVLSVAHSNAWRPGPLPDWLSWGKAAEFISSDFRFSAVAVHCGGWQVRGGVTSQGAGLEGVAKSEVREGAKSQRGVNFSKPLWEVTNPRFVPSFWSDGVQ